MQFYDVITSYIIVPQVSVNGGLWVIYWLDQVQPIEPWNYTCVCFCVCVFFIPWTSNFFIKSTMENATSVNGPSILLTDFLSRAACLQCPSVNMDPLANILLVTLGNMNSFLKNTWSQGCNENFEWLTWAKRSKEDKTFPSSD